MSSNSSTQDDRPIIIPFLKWAGGKRWLIERHHDLLDVEFNRFIEPFLGSGAVFFHLKPHTAILNDSNAELINTYQVIKDNWQALECALDVHHREHSKNYYYQIRCSTPIDPIEQAAKFIYLNRTCWNGLYRVNLKGQFNVPIGTKKNVVLDTDDFETISSLLQSTDLISGDFEVAIDQAGSGDFLFVDPPYTVKHNLNGFIKYNETLFSWDDQIRLRDAVAGAVERGAKVLLTNAYHESVMELYRDIGDLIKLSRASVISGKAEGRGSYEELIVKCF
ncbi:DNA adenine methylase [Emcibacter sp.]|uniref:DNA adenine methylase n=1 Tax=Emcibacter sp. TaxID=1979954 RepID=UPI003A941D43